MRHKPAGDLGEPGSGREATGRRSIAVGVDEDVVEDFADGDHDVTNGERIFEHGSEGPLESVERRFGEVRGAAERLKDLALLLSPCPHLCP